TAGGVERGAAHAKAVEDRRQAGVGDHLGDGAVGGRNGAVAVARPVVVGFGKAGIALAGDDQLVAGPLAGDADAGAGRGEDRGVGVVDDERVVAARAADENVITAAGRFDVAGAGVAVQGADAAAAAELAVARAGLDVAFPGAADEVVVAEAAIDVRVPGAG